jgi:plastocyanin
MLQRKVGTCAVALAAMLGSGAEAASLVVTLKDQEGAAVSDAVVYVATINGQQPAPVPRQVTVDQVDETFVPHVRAVAVGSSISFPNSDHIRHHVYSFAPAKTFELPLYIGLPAEPISFDQAGLVTLGCNIHDHMLGYVLVVETPYYAEVAAGTARLDNLPDGELAVRIWHPRLADDTALEFTVQTATSGDTALQQQLTLLPDRKARRAPRRGSSRY